MRLRAIISLSASLLLLVVVAWVISRPNDDTAIERASEAVYGGNGNVVASNSGGIIAPQPVSTSGVYLPPVPSVEGQAHVPDFVATQEAIVRELSATPTPTHTPLPPTATRMPLGWERLEELAVGSPMEFWYPEEADRRHSALREYLYDLPGTVIAENNASQASCYDGPTGYRVEEVLFPGEVQLDLGQPLTTDRYWRFIVTGGPFPVPPAYSGMTLEVDDWMRSSFLEPNGDRTELRILEFHPPVGYEGSKLAIRPISGKLIELPERLHFLEGRPERERLLPTPEPAYGSSAYKTAQAQWGYIDPTPDPTAQTIRERREYERDLLLETKGKVIAQNQYPAPRCESGPYAYSIEEIALPEKITLTTLASPVTIDRFWRINIGDLEFNREASITSSIPMNQMVCVGNTPFQIGGSGGPLIGILFDIAGLHEGDEIYMVYGRGLLSCSSGERRVLAEKLHFLSNPATVEPPPPNATEVACSKRLEMYDFLYTTPGRVIGQGSNNFATCAFGLETYRVEEIALPNKTTFALDEGPITVDKYWRLTVTLGTPSSPGGWISLDNQNLQVKWESRVTGLDGLTVLVFDPSHLREGAEIRFLNTYEAPGELLPERLHLFDSP